jgi:(1->4)-alpha-D-glucan 1-alpha-D-glucosylmutase
MNERPIVATYRLQIRPGFDLQAAAQVVPYLSRLGVDTLYLSPLLWARPGSAHGYDVIDPTRADPARGGEQGLRELARVAQQHRMHVLLDIVPNHLTATPDNPWWRDVLARGSRSKWASVFDIDWSSTRGRPSQIMLPVLTEPIDALLRKGRLKLRAGPRELSLEVEGATYPINARGTNRFLRAVRSRWVQYTDRRKRSPLRGGSLESLRRSIFGRAARSPAIDRAIAAVLHEFQSAAPRGVPNAFAPRLLNDQTYRLVPYWEDAEINYRRFFDVNHLIGVRVEDPLVFDRVHRRVLEWVRRGYVDGVRVDHVDGLADPLQYLQRLQRALSKARSRRKPPVRVWVEKILGPSEALAAEWPVDGTTGYDAMARLTGVLLDPEGASALASTYEWVVGARESFEAVSFTAKQQVQRELFRSETKRLASSLGERANRNAPDGRAAETGLIALTAGLPVYRTYCGDGVPRSSDAAVLAEARRCVRQRGSRAARRVLPSWMRGLDLDPPNRSSSAHRRGAVRIRRRWQQWTPAVAAKGVEDTAFYRYVPSVALNEVGANPGHFGTSVAEFHRFMLVRQRAAGASLTATSTHDTKWGEDARARLVALSDRADEWKRQIPAWFDWVDRRPPPKGGEPPVRRAEVYLLLQALVASRPIDGRERAGYPDRFRTYAIKASREAKVRTNWRRPDLAYEAAVGRLATWLATVPAPRRFRQELDHWTRSIAYLGSWNSIAMTLLKMTVPGVPDLYQGSERSALHLVDPDNRRPVDFVSLDRSLRRRRREAPPATSSTLRRLLRAWWTGELKQYVTQRALQFRRAHLELVTWGEYLPVRAEGRTPHEPLSFARKWGAEWALVVIGRHLGRLGASEERPPRGPLWAGMDIALPRGAPRTWQDTLVSRDPLEVTGARRRLKVGEIFATLPVALLYGRSSESLAASSPRRRPSDSRRWSRAPGP